MRALICFFSSLVEQAESYPFGAEWQQRMIEAAREQAAWLTKWIAAYAQTTGVVPQGLFEIQDVRDQTLALAVAPWSATDDWLSFIEAADHLGMSRELTRGWLDNLARAHGVTVEGTWGLDWVIPLQRPEAVSVELTAKFLRVARLLGYDAAADFVQWNLSRLRHGDQWPAVVTVASTDAPLATGQGRNIYPAESALLGKRKGDGTSARPHPASLDTAANGRGFAALGWPETLGVHAELADAAWPTKMPAGNTLETDPRTAAGYHTVSVDRDWFLSQLGGDGVVLVGPELRCAAAVGGWPRPAVQGFWFRMR